MDKRGVKKTEYIHENIDPPDSQCPECAGSLEAEYYEAGYVDEDYSDARLANDVRQSRESEAGLGYSNSGEPGLSKHRMAAQAVASLIQNANLKGFFSGRIYRGPLKAVCVPGLNCYSCPGAVGACPIGSLQNGLSGLTFKFPYYVVGILIFFGAILGRAVCGFICPFGFLQDLLNKIPFPKKIRTFKADRPLRKLKYAVLVVLVIAVPVIVKLTPAFCKYVCPSGTLSGLILSMADSRLFTVIGGLFTWKVAILLITVICAIMIYRPFCKYICPLGAIYAPFNKVSLFHMCCDKTSCVECGKCSSGCGMGADPSRDPDDTECIRCGACIRACPAEALKYEFTYKRGRK